MRIGLIVAPRSFLWLVRLGFNQLRSLAQKGLRLFVGDPRGLFHDGSEAGQGSPGLVLLAELMLRHGQERQCRPLDEAANSSARWLRSTKRSELSFAIAAILSLPLLLWFVLL